jgi:hypothetical protein
MLKAQQLRDILAKSTPKLHYFTSQQSAITIDPSTSSPSSLCTTSPAITSQTSLHSIAVAMLSRPLFSHRNFHYCNSITNVTPDTQTARNRSPSSCPPQKSTFTSSTSSPRAYPVHGHLNQGCNSQAQTQSSQLEDFEKKECLGWLVN